MSETRPKVLVGWSDNGSVMGQFKAAFDRMLHYEWVEDPSQTYELLCPLRTSGLYVQNNRNELILEAQKVGADWLLQLDGDETFSPNLLRTLMGTAHPTEKPIVAGLYSNVGNLSSEAGSFTVVDCIYGEVENGAYRTLVPPDDMHPFEVDAVGSGVLLTHMSVFEKIPGPWFWLELFQYPDGKKSMMNEDIGFCRLAKEYGFSIWCNPLAEIVHWKTLPLVPSTLRQFLVKAKDVEKQLAVGGAKTASV